MSEQAIVEPLVEEARRPKDGERAMGAAEENISSPAQSSSAASVAPTVMPPQVVSAPERRRGGRVTTVLFALLALIGAGVALAAPGLRPMVAKSADSLLGQGNAVSRLVAPAGSLNVHDMAMQAINAQLADYTARLDRLAAAQQATSADLSRVIVNLRAAHAGDESLDRVVDDLARQTKELHATTAAMDRRVRASGLLTLAMRLRRDLDAGLPLDGELAALSVSGPYPADIKAALQQLSQFGDGVPTMRDLAEGLDHVMARLTARADSQESWAGRNWKRVEVLFGGTPSPDMALMERVRSLGADGRFSEAATEILTSNAAADGSAWAARVRARATAVMATQSLLGYSLTEYEKAFATAGAQ